MPDPSPNDETLVNRLQAEGPSPHAGDDAGADGQPEADEELTARLESEGPSPHAGDDQPN